MEGGRKRERERRGREGAGKKQGEEEEGEEKEEEEEDTWLKGPRARVGNLECSLEPCIHAHVPLTPSFPARPRPASSSLSPPSRQHTCRAMGQIKDITKRIKRGDDSKLAPLTLWRNALRLKVHEGAVL